MKNIFSFLFSTRFMGVLMFVFAFAMAAATFIENDFGTPAAKKLVFGAWWFELTILLLAVNFIGNIKKYKLWSIEKLPVLVFHLAFIVIILGAGVSRLIAFEGTMHIREGEKSNAIVTDKTYIVVSTPEEGKIIHEKELLLTNVSGNDFAYAFEVDSKKVAVEYIQYIPHAKEVYEASENGQPMAHVVASSSMGGRKDYYIPGGSSTNVMGSVIAFNYEGDADVHIIQENGQNYLLSQSDIGFMRMADQSQGIVHKDSLTNLEMRALYTQENVSFVIKEIMDKAVLKLMPSFEEADKGLQDLVVVRVSSGQESQEVMLPGQRGLISQAYPLSINGIDVMMRYGSKLLITPFLIHLDDFQLERYPGSQSPNSFASEVRVEDAGHIFPFRIFMNHVLDYRGYRFFQSSYDGDEKGTVLSVNHDFVGTLITYVGYALLMFGMLLTLFWRSTRFRSMARSLGQNSAKISVLLVLFVGITQAAFSQAQQGLASMNVDSLILEHPIQAAHAAQFSRLMVQDEGGRMKPVHTLASEVLRKLYKKDRYKGLSASQVFLSMHSSPMLWSHVPIVRITKGNHNISALGNFPGAHASYADFFDKEGNYVLAKVTEEASKKKESDRTENDKLLLTISQRVTLMFEIFNGNLLRIFPMPGDANHKWYSYSDLEAGFKNEDSLFVYNVPYLYFEDLQQAVIDNNWEVADKKLVYFDKFQRHYGSDIFPSERKISLEILYNKIEIFNRLFQYYGLVGFVMLLLLIVNIFQEKKWIKSLANMMAGLVILMFVAHTAGLITRWYISGHAPWSNAYESMVYVAWSTVLAGLLFIKRSKITLAATAVMASTFLMVAHWSWMDPAIDNLVPVLNSYWLMIHVSIIVASYGPFTLGFIMGIISLILLALQRKKDFVKLRENIDRLTKINELIITIGLFMLTIGTFLGGVWANESWGRYWSWDPKETWALISVIIYSFVLHMRMIPGLKGMFAFNFAVVLSYFSILMTYFGVNYYLAGMHSYAKGDPIPIPDFLYYAVAAIALLGFVAHYRNKKMKKEMGLL